MVHKCALSYYYTMLTITPTLISHPGHNHNPLNQNYFQLEMLPYIHFCTEKNNNNYDAIYIYFPPKTYLKNGEKVVLYSYDLTSGQAR